MNPEHPTIVPTWPKTGTITYLKDNSYQKALATKILNAINFDGSGHNWSLETK